MLIWAQLEGHDERPIEVDIGGPIRALAFAAAAWHREYLVSGDKETVCIWRMKDRNLSSIATMAVGVVNCLAVSEDGKQTAAGR